jgi:L-threonylcarbamoyladenylate synthase
MTSEDHDQAGLDEAKKVLLSGGIVAFPTESFYGLAVNAMNEKAIQRLFHIKKRRSNRPILILIHDVNVLPRYVEYIPEVARVLIDRFWPGGLTLIFKAGPNISPLLTAGTGKIGTRLSSHPTATALARSIDGPITGTSANISGQPALLSAEEVYQYLGNKVELILDGGKTKGEKGSTILDITMDPPVILREGMVGRDQLKEVINE